MKKYQILYKGIYQNKLALVETDDPVEFARNVDDFKNGKFSNLLLISTNIYVV